MLQNASSRVASALASSTVGNFARRIAVATRTPWIIRGDPSQPAQSREITILSRVPTLRRSLASLLSIPDVQADLLGLQRSAELPALSVSDGALPDLSDDDARAIAKAVSNIPVMAFDHAHKYGLSMRALVMSIRSLWPPWVAVCAVFAMALGEAPASVFNVENMTTSQVCSCGFHRKAWYEGQQTLLRVLRSVETILGDSPWMIEPKAQVRVAVLSCIRAAAQCGGPTKRNLMLLRNLSDILRPSCEILRGMVQNGLKDDGRGGVMLGWLAPPGSPFQVLYGGLHPASIRLVVETAFDKAETRFRGNEVSAPNRMAVWLWAETIDFPFPQRWCGHGFGPNPTPAGDAWLELIREREIDGEYELLEFPDLPPFLQLLREMSPDTVDVSRWTLRQLVLRVPQVLYHAVIEPPATEPQDSALGWT